MGETSCRVPQSAKQQYARFTQHRGQQGVTHRVDDRALAVYRVVTADRQRGYQCDAVAVQTLRRRLTLGSRGGHDAKRCDLGAALCGIVQRCRETGRAMPAWRAVTKASVSGSNDGRCRCEGGWILQAEQMIRAHSRMAPPRACTRNGYTAVTAGSRDRRRSGRARGRPSAQRIVPTRNHPPRCAH
jgi:hypothetical protein